ncbi:MAG: hypothetical protein Q7T19_14730 [Caulobacter sp.]|nr:hypothetical protein [Caulobacter sp.]
MTSPRPAQRRTRNGLALAAAALLHVIFAFAVFATATGTAPRGAFEPFGDGEAVEVMLAGREGARAGGAAASEAISDVERLARTIRTQSDFAVSEPEPPGRSGDLSSLFKALGRFDAAGARGDGREALGDGATAGREARTASSATRGEATLDASSGELWGQVEPCWRRLAGRSTVPVTLEVTLDGKGGLAGPPRIVRPEGGRPSEQRLLAEARALEAIRACLPYRAPGIVGAGRAYRLAFRAAGSGR